MQQNSMFWNHNPRSVASSIELKATGATVNVCSHLFAIVGKEGKGFRHSNHQWKEKQENSEWRGEKVQREKSWEPAEWDTVSTDVPGSCCRFYDNSLKPAAQHLCIHTRAPFYTLLFLNCSKIARRYFSFVFINE